MHVGIYTLMLRAGAEADQFEKVMTEEIFPAAAETPGTMNRGAVSSIKSQHLLKSTEEKGKYWWLVKDSRALSSLSTTRLLQRILETVQRELDPLVTVELSATFEVISSYEVGERDTSGRPIGLPTTGNEL